jgi:hypothetical protein
MTLFDPPANAPCPIATKRDGACHRAARCSAPLGILPITRTRIPSRAALGDRHRGRSLPRGRRRCYSKGRTVRDSDSRSVRAATPWATASRRSASHSTGLHGLSLTTACCYAAAPLWRGEACSPSMRARRVCSSANRAERAHPPGGVQAQVARARATLFGRGPPCRNPG